MYTVGKLQNSDPDDQMNQEANGQQSFVDSDTLPIIIHGGAAKAILEMAGVEFLGPVEDDDLFQYVKLPPGWQKQPTDHSMWSKLVDEKGRERASIFYKAAFYDRNAHLHLSTRFAVSFDYKRSEEEAIAVAHVTDCGKKIHSTDPIRMKNDCDWEAQDKAKNRAEKWLKKHYPDWQNPGAYWD